MLPRVLRHLALVVLLALVVAATAHAAPSFMGLGALPGGFSSFAYGISGDGSTVVGDAEDGKSFQAVRWTVAEGAVVAIEPLSGGASAVPAAVSYDGSVVVGRVATASGTQAFRWTSGGGIVGLGDLAGGAFHSEAHGVSGDGSVVVGFGTSSLGDEAFRWTAAGGMVGLGDLPGSPFKSVALGISGDGSVVVGAGAIAPTGDPLFPTTEAFRWTSGDGMVAVKDLPGGVVRLAGASGISADGSVIVGSGTTPFTAGSMAVRWTPGGGMIGLGPPSTIADDVSSDGSVVVGGYPTAFIWDATNGARDLKAVLTGLGLDLTGWTLEEATGISDDGKTIVGRALNSSNGLNRGEGWIAVIPEPSTGLLFGAGLVVLAATRRRASKSCRASRPPPPRGSASA